MEQRPVEKEVNLTFGEWLNERQQAVKDGKEKWKTVHLYAFRERSCSFNRAREEGKIALTFLASLETPQVLVADRYKWVFKTLISSIEERDTEIIVWIREPNKRGKEKNIRLLEEEKERLKKEVREIN